MTRIFIIMLLISCKNFAAMAQSDSSLFQTVKVYHLGKKRFEKTPSFYKSVLNIEPYTLHEQLVLKGKYNTHFTLLNSPYRLARTKIDSSKTKRRPNSQFTNQTAGGAFEKQFASIKVSSKINTDSKPQFTLSGSSLLLVIFGERPFVELYKTANQQKIRTINLVANYARKVIFSPDETKIAILTNKNTVELYSIISGQLINTIKEPRIAEQEVSDLCFLDNQQILLTYDFPNRGPLYLFTIAIDKYPSSNLRNCVSDAKKFEDLMVKTSFGMYDSLVVLRLHDNEATRANIQKTFQVINSSNHSTSNSTLMLYLSGHAGSFLKPFSLSRGVLNTKIGIDTTKTEETAFLCYDSKFGDLKSYLWAGELKSMILLSACQNHILVGDASSSYGLFEDFHERSNHRGFKPVKIKNYVIFGMEVGKMAMDSGTDEEGNNIGGPLTHFFLTSWKNNELFCPYDGKLTTSELNSQMILNKSKRASFYNNESIRFYTNADFPLRYTFLDKPNADFEPPLVKTDSIPAATTQNEILLTITAYDNKGIKKVMVNDREADFIEEKEKEVKYRMKVGLKNGENEIIITAEDINGLTTTLTSSCERKSSIPRNYAYFFATDEYDDKDKWIKLNNPIRDAKAIAIELYNRYGFDTTITLNPTVEILDSMLVESTKINKGQFGEEDRLFVFMSGHGYYDPQTKRGGLVAKDSRGSSFNTYYSYSNLIDILANHPCKHIFLVIDVCYSGTFFESIATKSEQKSTKRGIEILNSPEPSQSLQREMAKYKTRIALTSSGKEEVSDGYKNSHSPFATFFLEAIRTSAVKILTATYIKSALKDLNPFPRLAPFKGNEPGGDFIFIKKK